MAAARWWRLVPRGPGRSVHSAAQAAVGTPDVPGAEGAAAPVARYPPIVASMTADSKAARQRRVERWQAAAHAARTADEKIRILSKMQFKKYVVYPQTFALNADRWYQGFTKTAFLSGLPPPAEPGSPPAEPGSPPAEPGSPPAEPAPPPAPDLATLRAAACDCLLQEHFYLRRQGRAPLYRQVEAVASPFLDQLVATLMGLLSAHNPVLATAALGEPGPATRGGAGGRAMSGAHAASDVPPLHSSVRFPSPWTAAGDSAVRQRSLRWERAAWALPPGDGPALGWAPRVHGTRPCGAW